MRKRELLFLVALLIAVSAPWIISCSQNLVEKPEQAPNPPHTIRTLAGDINLTLYEVDGCQYITRGESIIHKANCPNHNQYNGAAKQ